MGCGWWSQTGNGWGSKGGKGYYKGRGGKSKAQWLGYGKGDDEGPPSKKTKSESGSWPAASSDQSGWQTDRRRKHDDTRITYFNLIVFERLKPEYIIKINTYNII